MRERLQLKAERQRWSLEHERSTGNGPSMHPEHVGPMRGGPSRGCTSLASFVQDAPSLFSKVRGGVPEEFFNPRCVLRGVLYAVPGCWRRWMRLKRQLRSTSGDLGLTSLHHEIVYCQEQANAIAKWRQPGRSSIVAAAHILDESTA